MTDCELTLKPLHLGALAVVVGIAVTAGAALALTGGGDEAAPAGEVRAETAITNAEPVSAANEAVVAAAAPEPAPEPDPAPVEAAAPEPVSRTNCADIKATGYQTDGERDFYLANCVTRAAAAHAPARQTDPPRQPPAQVPQNPAPAAPPAAAPAGPTEEEGRYRRQAQAQLAYFITRLNQYYGTASNGFYNDILEIAGVAGQFVNTLDSIAPVPPRFSSAHNQLRAAMVGFRDHARTGTNITTAQQYNAWAAGFAGSHPSNSSALSGRTRRCRSLTA